MTGNQNKKSQVGCAGCLNQRTCKKEVPEQTDDDGTYPCFTNPHPPLETQKIRRFYGDSPGR